MFITFSAPEADEASQRRAHTESTLEHQDNAQTTCLSGSSFWPSADVRVRFDARLKSSSSVSLGDLARPQEVTVDVDATVAMQRARVGDQDVVVVELEEVRAHDVDVLGAQLAASPQDLAGAVAVELREGGHISRLGFADKTTPAARGVLTTIARSISRRPTRRAREWSAREVRAHGDAQTLYTRVECGEDFEQLESTRRDWQSVWVLPGDRSELDVGASGVTTRARIERARGLVELTEDATLRVGAPSGRARVDAMLRLEHVAAVAPRGELPFAWVWEHDPSDRVSRDALLEARAAGMTWGRVEDDLRRYGAVGLMPEHREWLWRVTGLMKLDPEMAAALAALFHDPELGPRGRALIVDLLANVGDAPAQAALRELLGSAAVRERGEYRELAQRAILLESAELETAELFADQLLELRGDEWGAAAVALGATSRGLEADDAASVLSPLLTACERGCSDRTRQDALLGLGNAGVEETLGVVRDVLDGEHSEETRAVAVHALRHVRSDEAREVLIEQSVGSARQVRIEALRALAHQELSHEQARDWVELTGQVRWSHNEMGALLNAIDAVGVMHPALALAALERLRASEQVQGQVRARIMAMIRELARS